MLEVRRFFENLLGIEPVAAGEDTSWHVRFALGWPDWVLALFVVVSVTAVLGLYFRERAALTGLYRGTLAVLRLAVVALLVMMLGGLELLIDRTGLPYLVIMVDDSESMSVQDQMDASAPEPPTRVDRIKSWLAQSDGAALKKLVREHKIQLYAHSTTPRLVGTYIEQSEIPSLLEELNNLQPRGGDSRLGSNLRTVLNTLRGTPPSAVVMVTDGVTTNGEPLPQTARYAARKNTPVFAVGVGDPKKQRDLELADLLVDHTVFVNDVVAFEGKLIGTGVQGEDVAVSLRDKADDAVLDSQSYTVGGDGEPVSFRLTHRPTKAGEVNYVVEVPVLQRELERDNNHLERHVRVIDEKIKVLYVDAFPRYEFRYLKHLLERENSVELNVVLLDSDPDYVQQDRAAIGFIPTTKDELFAYDVLIFGDFVPTLLSQAQLANVREFVHSKGGGFMLVAGRNFTPQSYRDTPLEDLIPVEAPGSSELDRASSVQEGFTPRLTVEGRASPMFRFVANDQENQQIWNTLPYVYWYATVEKAKPGAMVLVEHPLVKAGDGPMPLVATQFYGAGRTYYQGFDSTWRWRFRVEDLYHARYWVQAVRFLSRAKLLGQSRAVEFVLDRQKYVRGEPVTIRLRFLDESVEPKSDDGVSFTVQRGGDPPRTVTMKRLPGPRAVYEAVLAKTQDGQYRLRLASPVLDSGLARANFTVVPPPGELDDVQMNEQELKELAATTGGRFFPIAEADKLFSTLPKGRRVALHTDPPIAIWNTWPVLLLFTGLLVAEWVLRKRKSML